MPSRRRDRQRRPARETARRQPRRRLLVVCEGKVTEPEYIRGLAGRLRCNMVKIEIVPRSGRDLRLIERALKERERADRAAEREGDAFLRYDDVWCVYDVDDTPRGRLTEARDRARKTGLRLAVSNPCFELWLLLHFRDSPGARQRADVQRMQEGYTPGYGKHVDFSLFCDGLADAERRSCELDSQARGDGEPHRNPTTGMYLLVSSIRSGC